MGFGALAQLLPFLRLSPSPGYHADQRKHGDTAPQGVVKDVVFPSGKQDSNTTIEVGTLHGLPQAGPAEVCMVQWQRVPGALPWRKKKGVSRLPYGTVTLLTLTSYGGPLILIVWVVTPSHS